MVKRDVGEPTRHVERRDVERKDIYKWSPEGSEEGTLARGLHLYNPDLTTHAM